LTNKYTKFNYGGQVNQKFKSTPGVYLLTTIRQIYMKKVNTG